MPLEAEKATIFVAGTETVSGIITRPSTIVTVTTLFSISPA
jgi:hypothetical protein